MIKIVLKILLISSISIGIGLYANYLMTGDLPNLVLHKSNMPVPGLSKISESVTKLFDFSGEGSSDSKYLYKWRNAKGIIHYTSEKPAADIEVETIELSRDTNIVPAVSEASIKQNDSHKPSPETRNLDVSAVNHYSPQGIEQLFDQANNVKDIVNEHYEQQNSSSKQQ